eukprot:6181381-Pleurochrysis_carterae.AAC.1
MASDPSESPPPEPGSLPSVSSDDEEMLDHEAVQSSAQEGEDMPAFLQDGRRFTARRRSFTSRQINDEWLDEAASADGEATKRLRGASLFVYLGCAALLLTACAALGMWLLMERPVTCEAHKVRLEELEPRLLVLPQRFKIDVTEFWSPRLSSTLQLVLSVRNSNLFSSMLLEECAVTVFEAATGQKLGVAKHGRLHVEPRQTMQEPRPLFCATCKLRVGILDRPRCTNCFLRQVS